MRTSNALLMSLGLVSSLAAAQSTSNLDSDVQPATPANLPAPAPMSRLEPQTVNGVTYLCGGVGADEAKFMKRSSRDYDMMLTFATKRGEYLSDVNVDIKDANGKSLMQATCGGPMMLVDFPQGGTYRVHAETGGFSLSKTAHISARQDRKTASVVMHWPQQIGQEPPVSTGSSSESANGDYGSGNSGGPADPTGRGQ